MWHVLVGAALLALFVRGCLYSLVGEGLSDLLTSAAAVLAAQLAVGAFPLPAGSKDAVLLLTLAPGAYTAQVSGVGAGEGVALVEIYQAP